MSTLTQAEKIKLAEEEVKSAENMVQYTRKKLQTWIDRLELRQEYLEQLKKGKK